METLTVNASTPYPVHIGPGLLEKAGELIAGVTKSRTCAVITDTTVEKLYAAPVCRAGCWNFWRRTNSPAPTSW